MARFVKMIVGLMLLPLCIGTAATLWRILQMLGSAGTVWVPLAVGAAAWVLVYLLFPRPMWLYVFGHELTHAVWAWCFGGRVRGMNVGSGGGHVSVSKTNFVIALAPYFFPFYAAVVMVLFFLGQLVLPWHRLEVWFLGSLGAAYAFHLTLTAHVLKTRQSDITEHGYIFSAAIIFIGNVWVLLLGLSLLTSKPSLSTACSWCWEATAGVVRSVQAWIT